MEFKLRLGNNPITLQFQTGRSTVSLDPKLDTGLSILSQTPQTTHRQLKIELYRNCGAAFLRSRTIHIGARWTRLKSSWTPTYFEVSSGNSIRVP